jgi:hypothetical protein
MKKLMTAVLGLSLLTGLAAVSFASPDEPAKTETKKKKKAKTAKPPKKDKKAEDTK